MMTLSFLISLKLLSEFLTASASLSESGVGPEEQAQTMKRMEKFLHLLKIDNIKSVTIAFTHTVAYGLCGLVIILGHSFEILSETAS